MNRRIRKPASVLFLVVVIAILSVLAVNAIARQSGNKPVSRAYLHSYNLPSSGVALEGYCPVAYFLAGKPVLGKEKYAPTYNDVTYYFVSLDAKKTFEKDPEKYLPAYGGWCATGIALGDKFPVDPTAFKIVDGRLLLFLRNANIDTLKMWNEGNEAELLAKADANWEKISQ